MKHLFQYIFIVLLCVTITGVAQKPSQELENYIRQNDAEKRLAEYKDNNDLLALKVRHLAVINASRKKHKAPALQLDILASRMANKMAADAAKNGFSGHFNLNGESPYHRYASAGGQDHVVENAAATTSSADFVPDDENILEGMYELHQAFMNEKAPNDGHKQTCIGKTFTHVGIGVAWHGKEFRYYEEYLNRYLAFGEVKSSVKAGTDITLSVKPLEKGYHLYSVVAYYEAVPKKMTAKQVSAIASYADYTSNVAANIAPWELPQPDDKGFVHISIPTKKKGLYYIHVFLDTKPYVKGKATTQGKIIGSGVVVEVK
ncbi:Cysteine-rich secretory protein family protein [Breznakibacter xylanolyticus]|uniref:Cysteine-rich secretory protein family protein n=1 Tax=Breznakibacter xylanolyticus TaxID=990 RepID=A0A2W7MXX9_9BACT|nr:CAP domain-containing protein [Breznakibacter xylanolyticus]PZX12403.1 Cysteine-rich secretory protein family protein [Breznakibacter xylanolyticus]